MFTNKRILITGGTGSLGQVLVHRLMTGEMGVPAKVIVFSRDETKQHDMRMRYRRLAAATDEIIYRDFEDILAFRIGDIRDLHSVSAVLREVQIVFNAAALKQVPTCEYFPFEATQTNIGGAQNIVTAIRDLELPVETVVGVSTDKACKPVNVMGMTKAIQERVFLQANMSCPQTRFVCVRYGNVLASRGSVIPLFHAQIRSGGPVTITMPHMTRFLLSLDQAVDTIFTAVREANRGEIYVPRVPSAKIIDIAGTLIAYRNIEIAVIGIRPGEKVHEILVSEEECHRTVERGNHYVILPVLPELRQEPVLSAPLDKEYCSADQVMDKAALEALLHKHKLMVEDVRDFAGEQLA